MDIIINQIDGAGCDMYDMYLGPEVLDPILASLPVDDWTGPYSQQITNLFFSNCLFVPANGDRLEVISVRLQAFFTFCEGYWQYDGDM